MSLKRWSFVASLLVCLAVVSTAVQAQDNQPGRRFGGGGFGGGFGRGGGGSLSDLLRNPRVREEVEVVDDQWEEVQEVARESTPDLRSLFADFRDLSEEERRERFTQVREQQEKAEKEVEKKLAEILLPHQMDRLKELHVQAMMQRQGTARALTSDPLAQELKLTEDEIEKVRQAAEEAQEELRKAIAKAQEESQEKILSALSASKRSKIKEMMGKPSDAIEGGVGAGFGGRGGDGGFGRGRGGRGGFGGRQGGEGGRRGNRPARPDSE